MKISVVIRTKNSGKTLQQCLESLRYQTITPAEIVVVDSGSADITLEIANQYGCKVVYYPSNNEFNYSKALNLGIEATSSDYILIISSHVYLKYSNTIELMLSFLTSWLHICAVSTARDSVKEVLTTPNLKEANWSLINSHNFQGQGMFNFCSLIRRADWNVYPFNESLPRCEDQDWALHFYKKNNSGSIVLWHPTVFYENPYYNARKDAWDYIILGHHIYSYFISKRFVNKILLDGIQSFFKMKFVLAYHNLIIAYLIILDRFKGTYIHSTYNKILAKK